MKKTIYYSLVCFLGLLTLACSLFLTTEFGLQITLELLPGKAKAENIRGSLIRGWTIKGFDYQKKDFHISMDEIHFSWQPARLLKQDFVIHNLQIKNLTIDIKQAEKESEPLPYFFNVPVDIYLEKAKIMNINIHYNDSHYLINDIETSAQLLNNTLTITKAVIKTPDFYTSSTGNIDLAKFKKISLLNQLNFSSYPEVAITTSLHGDRNSLKLDINSKKWLTIKISLQHYLDRLDNISFKAQWLINAGKTEFKELKKVNGQLSFSGQAYGNLLKPVIVSQLLMKNIRYGDYKIDDIKSSLNFSLGNDNKINFSLLSKRIMLEEKLIENINAKIIGTTTKHKVYLRLSTEENNTFSFNSINTLAGRSYFIKQANFNATPFNINLYPISLYLNFNKNREIFYETKIQHKEEKLDVTGKIKLASGNFTGTANILSKKFTLIDSEYYKIIISPDLRMNYDHNEVHAKGDVNIIDAHVAPTDFSNTVTLSNDIVYTNKNDEPLHENSKQLKIFFDIAIKIQKFFINYNGVAASVYGNLKVNKTPETEISAIGELKFLEGTYKAYGQNLTIRKNSHINFTHEIDNPQLNISAEKEIKASSEYISLPTFQPYLIVGVKISGTAQQPKITLFSIPASVSQQDILSYLIFGMSQKQLTGSQISLLWSTLNILSSSNGNKSSLSGLQKNIQKSLGFSEFGLGSTSEYNSATQQYETGTAFVVGKKITDNLTATYNIGLLIPINVLYLRYQLAHQWTLQTDSSALGNGADIFYTIATD